MLLFRSSLNSKPWEVLGIPIEAATKNQEFDFVIERVRGRLSGWKAHLLSFARRVFITQLGLYAISAYVMQGIMLLGKTLEAIDKASRNFVWGSSVEKMKLHIFN